MLILVDAMGGDHAPNEIIKGCIDAITEKEGFEVLLIGEKEKIQTVLNDHKFSSNRLKILNTTEVISNEDSPTKAIKNKKDSSMVVGFNLLKEKKGIYSFLPVIQVLLWQADYSLLGVLKG